MKLKDLEKPYSDLSQEEKLIFILKIRTERIRPEVIKKEKIKKDKNLSPLEMALKKLGINTKNLEILK